MRERIHRAQARLQTAAASGDYQGVAEALDELLAAIEEAVRQRVAIKDLLPAVLNELEQARRLILAARAHDAARLARVRRLPAEYGSGVPARCSIQIQG